MDERQKRKIFQWVKSLIKAANHHRKLREDIERIIEILKNGQQAHWQTFKIRQLLEVPLE